MSKIKVFKFDEFEGESYLDKLYNFEKSGDIDQILDSDDKKDKKKKKKKNKKKKYNNEDDSIYDGVPDYDDYVERLEKLTKDKVSLDDVTKEDLEKAEEADKRREEREDKKPAFDPLKVTASDLTTEEKSSEVQAEPQSKVEIKKPEVKPQVEKRVEPVKIENVVKKPKKFLRQLKLKTYNDINKFVIDDNVLPSSYDFNDSYELDINDDLEDDPVGLLQLGVILSTVPTAAYTADEFSNVNENDKYLFNNVKDGNYHEDVYYFVTVNTEDDKEYVLAYKIDTNSIDNFQNYITNYFGMRDTETVLTKMYLSVVMDRYIVNTKKYFNIENVETFYNSALNKKDEFYDDFIKSLDENTLVPTKYIEDDDGVYIDDFDDADSSIRSAVVALIGSPMDDLDEEEDTTEETDNEEEFINPENLDDALEQGISNDTNESESTSESYQESNVETSNSESGDEWGVIKTVHK